MEIFIDTSDFSKWSSYYEDLPRRSDLALANSLNFVGEEIVKEMAAYLAEKTGLEPDDIIRSIVVSEASMNDLTWSADASAVVIPESPNWERPWDSPGDNTFGRETLLDIVNMDDCACEICKQAAEDGPYTPSQIADMAAKWKDFVPPYPVTGPRTNCLHPNCRCSTVPHYAQRRLPLQMGNPDIAPPQLFTTQQLAKEVAAEELVVLKVHD